jgi:hypothetical protein
MTISADRRSSAELIETVETYRHLVRQHGWDENPYLLSQSLRRLHRDEHVDADSGIVTLDHAHEGLVVDAKAA